MTQGPIGPGLNVAGSLRFQLILGIYLATGEVGEFAFKGVESRYSIVFLQNAGVLWGEETGLWEVPAVATAYAFDQLRADIETRVLPFLERCDSVDAVIRTLDDVEDRVGWRAYFHTVGDCPGPARPDRRGSRAVPKGPRVIQRWFG